MFSRNTKNYVTTPQIKARDRVEADTVVVVAMLSLYRTKNSQVPEATAAAVPEYDNVYSIRDTPAGIFLPIGILA